jgi:mutator protein MutT
MTVPIKVGIALISRNSKYLVRRRPDLPGSPMPGYWEFPGGKCERDECPADAAMRECREESGLTVEIRSTRGVVTHDYPHGRVELHYFECEPRDAAAEPAAGSGFRWVAAQALGSLSFPEANNSIVHELAGERHDR